MFHHRISSAISKYKSEQNWDNLKTKEYKHSTTKNFYVQILKPTEHRHLKRMKLIHVPPQNFLCPNTKANRTLTSWKKGWNKISMFHHKICYVIISKYKSQQNTGILREKHLYTAEYNRQSRDRTWIKSNKQIKPNRNRKTCAQDKSAWFDSNERDQTVWDRLDWTTWKWRDASIAMISIWLLYN